MLAGPGCWQSAGSENTTDNGFCSGVDDFADANLRSVVVDTINQTESEIVSEDLADLRNLDATSSNISDLSGIQCLTNLSTLGLSDNTETSAMKTPLPPYGRPLLPDGDHPAPNGHPGPPDGRPDPMEFPL